MFRLFRRVPSVSAILPHSLSQERSKEKIGLARWDGFSISIVLSNVNSAASAAILFSSAARKIRSPRR
jgi:hypothetical protein